MRVGHLEEVRLQRRLPGERAVVLRVVVLAVLGELRARRVHVAAFGAAKRAHPAGPRAAPRRAPTAGGAPRRGAAGVRRYRVRLDPGRMGSSGARGRRRRGCAASGWTTARGADEAAFLQEGAKRTRKIGRRRVKRERGCAPADVAVVAARRPRRARHRRDGSPRRRAAEEERRERRRRRARARRPVARARVAAAVLLATALPRDSPLVETLIAPCAFARASRRPFGTRAPTRCAALAPRLEAGGARARRTLARDGARGDCGGNRRHVRGATTANTTPRTPSAHPRHRAPRQRRALALGRVRGGGGRDAAVAGVVGVARRVRRRGGVRAAERGVRRPDARRRRSHPAAARAEP